MNLKSRQNHKSKITLIYVPNPNCQIYKLDIKSTSLKKLFFLPQLKVHVFVENKEVVT